MWFLTVGCLLMLMLACIWTSMLLHRKSQPTQSLSGASDQGDIEIKNNPRKTRKKYKHSNNWGCY
jgi:hypothetical protein